MDLKKRSYNKMEDIIKYFEGEGYEVIVGWKDKERKNYRWSN